MSVERRRSRLWFLMPVMFGLIGTAIAYFVLRDDDPKLAKNCLYLGLVLFGMLTTVVFNYISCTLNEPTMITPLGTDQAMQAIAVSHTMAKTKIHPSVLFELV